MTALEPTLSNSTTHQHTEKKHLDSSETLLLNSDLLQKNQYSPLISTSTVTKIDLFRKYKQQIANNTPTSESLVASGANSANFEDLKTYSTPPQSPPFALLLRSSSAPLSPLIPSNFSTSIGKSNHSNLMVNEDSKKDDEIKCSTSSGNQLDNTTKNNNFEQQHLQIKQNNELLKEKLKLSYERFKSIQTNYFHTHVAEQLNKILELKEKQKSTSLTNSTTNNQDKIQIKEEANKTPIVPQQQTTNSQIDDNSVDLLTSILKSNLNNHTHLATTTNSNVDVAVKSLLDDIKYEILKQTDDKRQHQLLDEANVNNSDTDNEDNESSVTTTSSLLNDTFNYQLNDSVFDDVDLALQKLKSVNKKQHQKTDILNESTDFLNESVSKTTFINANAIKQQNEEKKLIDSSNLFWNMNKSQLSSSWECVQTKLKYLKLKQKQCNDYTNKCNRLINVNNSTNIKTLLNTSTTKSTTSQLPVSESTLNATTKLAHEEAAIAALSSSLQESIAAVVNTTTQPNNLDSKTSETTTTMLNETGLTASRCIPFKASLKNKARLFNLNRNDLIKLDDDVIRSLYFTLKYFSNNYFKTMCSCSQLNRIKRNIKQRTFQKSKNLQQEAECSDDELEEYENELSQSKKLKKSLNDEQVSLSDLLSMNKTCIFCHLLKEYEKNKMNEINLNNKNLIETKYSKQIDLNDEDEDNGSKLADLNVVRSDHSYCKQSIQSKRLNSANSSLAATTSNETNELLERLVSDRLNRIFNTENASKTTNNKFIFEKYSKYEDNEELIDAGLDLSPNDLQNLPDLSYEELKFLNDFDDSRKFNPILNENLDEIDICDDLINNESIFLNQSYPLFKQQLNNKNDKLLSSSFTYKPKYRNILKQSPNKNNKKRKIETTLNELQKQTSNESTHSKKGRKQSVSNELKKSQTKKLSSSLSSSSTSSLFNARQKRTRSTSSSTTSSSSSSSSFNDSSSTDQAKSSSGYYYNYYITNSQNKFDIDNIVIPHDMVSNAKSVHLEQKNVPTPRWRIIDIEPLTSTNQFEIEPLDDTVFVERHKQKEHEMIVNRSRIFKKNKSTRSLSSSFSTSPMESSNNTLI